MLVLGRKVGESITIGDGIEVTVLDVRGDMVRVGIKAPRSVAVHRSELLAELESSNVDAASPALSDAERLAEQLKGKTSPGEG